jgi:hypothetical protein
LGRRQAAAVQEFQIPEPEQIGSAFALTRERIRQIEVRAIRSLKHAERHAHLRSLWSAVG